MGREQTGGDKTSETNLRLMTRAEEALGLTLRPPGTHLSQLCQSQAPLQFEGGGVQGHLISSQMWKILSVTKK